MRPCEGPARRVRQLIGHLASGYTFEKAPPDAEYACHAAPCYFPASQTLSVPVLAARSETHNSKVITFGLPAAVGSFQLLIKTYEEGMCSAYADQLKPGDIVRFKQLEGNVKPWQYPFHLREITMVAGGTGITPMIQALYPLLTTGGDTTQIRLLYGNSSLEDIMLRTELETLAAAYPTRLAITYVVGKSATAESGWVETIKRFGFPPGSDHKIWVCGPEGMYSSLAGSRAKPLTPDCTLSLLGFTDDDVWRS